MWNFLPLRLLGGRYVKRPWDINGWWIWTHGDNHFQALLRSVQFEFADCLADTMRHWWVWWIATERDQALRAGTHVDAWKIGDTWFELSNVPPWPFPKGPAEAAHG